MIFYKEPTGLLSVYNNSIFEFGHGSNATIEVEGYAFSISSDAQNKFYFNLKEIAKAVVNESEFNDIAAISETVSLDPTLSKEVTVTFTVDNTDTSVKTVSFLKAAYQIGELDKRDDIRVLLPSNQLTKFKGKDLDFSVWSDQARTLSGLNLQKGVNRIKVTDDGQVRYFEEGYFDEGYFASETIKFTDFNGLQIKKRDCQNGRYMKWFSRYGGWCYWQFKKWEKEIYKTKKLEDINRDEDQVQDTDKNFSPLGNLLSRQIELHTGQMDELERWYFVDFIASPKKYLEINNKWIEVKPTPQAQQ